MATVSTPRAITVVGSINRDLTLRVPRLPHRGETLSGKETYERIGGKGANQAVAAAKLGGTVEWIGAVGHDGKDVLSKLRDQGVAVDHAVVLPEQLTGVAVILVEDGGENAIVLTPGANGGLVPDHIPYDVKGLLLVQNEVPWAVVESTLRKSPDAITIYNPAPFLPQTDTLLDLVDVLVLNEAELSQLAGRKIPVSALSEARHALEELPKVGGAAIATLGSEGALVRSGTLIRHVPAPKVTPVDTVGAGDTFCGALAVALSSNRSLLDSVEFAVHAASLSVLGEGAQEAMPDYPAVQRALSRHCFSATQQMV
ncbi:ribokinase [Nesterenkonia muleiensis]|uniref:ribokinase n=1 Tax=Nesterenkonia muleiensis TaxID=2282648 RepID=UPI0013001EA2|nr:ribokinase [Nesterenkonia muleiensis]